MKSPAFAILCGLFAFSSMAAGPCGGSSSTPQDSAPADKAAADQPAAEQPPKDMPPAEAAPDAGADTTMPDASADSTPDTTMPDAPMPDAPMPDAPMPDAPMPDAPMPDAPMPDAPADMAPDLAPDLAPDAAPDLPMESTPADTSGGTCFPTCVTDLQAACIPSGACMYQMFGSPYPTNTNFCYDNGVKSQTVIKTFTYPIQTTTTFKKTTGSTCYILDSATAADMHTDYTWKNAGGTTVATGTFEVAMTNIWHITCTASGMMYDIDTDSPACMGMGATPDGGTCVAGTCSF